MDAKKILANLALEVDKRLEDYWNGEIKRGFGFIDNQKALVNKMLSHAKEHNLRAAKRLRASFVIFAFRLGNKMDERIWKAAMAVELVHTALLMHDDVMDEDELRRGKPTTHKYFENGDRHFGESMAYDLGDTVLSIGYELLAKSDFEASLVNKAVIQLLRGAANTGFGQAYDISLEKFINWTEEDVIALHKAKTAIYTYENPLLIGAILGKLSEPVRQVLQDYAMDGGVAFQLQDDILGAFGDSEITGKSDDSDLLQGKCTLLVLKALELGNEEEKRVIREIWGKRNASKEKINRAKEAIINSGSLDYSRKISRLYAQKAVKTAEKLKKLKLNEEARNYIQGIAQYMVERDV